MQANPPSPEHRDALAAQTIRRNAKSVLRSLTIADRERLAKVEQQRFQAQCEFRQKCIECENAVEHIFDNMNKI